MSRSRASWSVRYAVLALLSISMPVFLCQLILQGGNGKKTNEKKRKKQKKNNGAGFILRPAWPGGAL
jgi:hypothetical protein